MHSFIYSFYTVFLSNVNIYIFIKPLFSWSTTSFVKQIHTRTSLPAVLCCLGKALSAFGPWCRLVPVYPRTVLLLLRPLCVDLRAPGQTGPAGIMRVSLPLPLTSDLCSLTWEKKLVRSGGVKLRGGIPRLAR